MNPFRSRFRTSGCQFATGPQRVTGTVECTARGGFGFIPGFKAAASPAAVTGGELMQPQGCTGGQDGRIPQGASLPVARGIAVLRVTLASGSCRELTDPTGPATVNGEILWTDAGGHEIGRSTFDAQPVDVRGGTATIRADSQVFPGHTLALGIAPDATGCGSSPAWMLGRSRPDR